jgi:hypothetical protein
VGRSTGGEDEMGRLKAGSVSWRRKRSRRRTAAAKKVLSPISESTVMASDLVNPCRQRGEQPSATIHLHPVRSADARAPDCRERMGERERCVTPSRDGAMAEA